MSAFPYEFCTVLDANYVARFDPHLEAGTVPPALRELGDCVLRWTLPRSLRQTLNQAFLSSAPNRRGPPGSCL